MRRTMEGPCELAASVRSAGVGVDRWRLSYGVEAVGCSQEPI